MRKIRLGIRQKMLAILVMVLMVSISLSGWFTLQKQEKELYDAIDLRGQEVVRFASHALALYALSYDYHGIQLLLDDIITSPDILHARVISVKGNIMASAGPPAQADEERPRFQKDLQFDDQSVGQLLVELDPADIVRRVEQQRNDLLLRELALIFLVALGEFLALSYFIARPVSVISNSLEDNIDADGRIANKIPLQSRDEFGRLAGQFNLMREQLNAAHAKLRSRIEAADARLLETNEELVRQSAELQQMNDKLVTLSITDPLTGLFNRRHFEEIIELENDYCKCHGMPCSLMIMDIDHFKSINDTYGHAIGDEVLKEVAALIRVNIRDTDVPCRIGGEEFVVACRDTDENMALDLAERLRLMIEQQVIRLDELRINFTMSIGVASKQPGNDELTVENLIHIADRALYHSKETGRNRVTHYRDIHDQDQNPDQANS